jgi:hypothetical protein
MGKQRHKTKSQEIADWFDRLSRPVADEPFGYDKAWGYYFRNCYYAAGLSSGSLWSIPSPWSIQHVPDGRIIACPLSPTGKAIGAFVLDLDAGQDKDTGEVFSAEDLAQAIAKEIGTALPPTWTADTPRGGRHLYFALPAGDPPGNRAGVVNRVDVRGQGGYVIVPPSLRPDGKAYRWIIRPW